MSEKKTGKLGLMKELFFAFAKIGVCTFGGGLTMLPMFTRELVEKRKWTTEDELLDYYAIGQCTPGLIAINTATFVGYKLGGIAGGVMATVGMVMPSLLIILAIAAFLSQFMENVWLQHAMVGVRAVVCSLMANTVWKLAKKSVVDLWCFGLFLAALLIAFFTGFPTVLLVVIAGVLGFALKNMAKVGRK